MLMWWLLVNLWPGMVGRGEHGRGSTSGEIASGICSLARDVFSLVVIKLDIA